MAALTVLLGSRVLRRVRDKLLGALSFGQYNNPLPILADTEIAMLQLDGSGRLICTMVGGGAMTVEGPVAQDVAVNGNPVEISYESEAWDGLAFSVHVPVSADGDVVRPKASWYGVGYSFITDQTGAGRLLYQEDVASAGAEWGPVVLTVRQDTLASNTDASGDFTYLKVDALGALYCLDQGMTKVGDAPASADIKPLDLGAVILDTDPVLAGTDGRMGRLRLDSMYRLIVRQASQYLRAGGYEAPAITLPANAVYDTCPLPRDPNYSTRRTLDGTATWATASTLTLATVGSYPMTTNQILEVVVNTGSGVRKLQQGKNGALLTLSGAGSPYTITVSGCGANPLTAGAVPVDVLWVGPDKGTYAEDAAAVSGDLGFLDLHVRRDTCVSSAGSDGDYATPNQDADGYDYTRDKSYDAASAALRNLPATDLSARRTAGDSAISLLPAAQTITNAWLDMGPENSVPGANKVRLYLYVTKGDGTVTTVQVRCLAKHTSGGTEEYILPVTKVDATAVPYIVTQDDEIIYPFVVNATALRTSAWELDNTIPIVQFQIQATTAGTTMVVTTAYIMWGWA